MRGSPLLRALAALALLLGLGIPMRHLLQTPSEASTPAAPVPAPEAKAPLHLQVSFTRVPARLVVKSLGEVVWTVEKPAADQETEVPLAFPKEGVDLQFEVAWPEGEPAAARVRLTDPEGRVDEKFLWGAGATTDVLTFP